jgi:hypothetical protein
MIEEKDNKWIKQKVTEVIDLSNSGGNSELSSTAYSSGNNSTDHLQVYEQDPEYYKTNSSPRGQNHPLCLIVQAIPFYFSI